MYFNTFVPQVQNILDLKKRERFFILAARDIIFKTRFYQAGKNQHFVRILRVTCPCKKIKYSNSL